MIEQEIPTESTPEKLTSEVYPRLYHYTTLEGVIGIIETQSLWATQYKFLNDPTEITFVKDKLEEFLTPHVQTLIEQVANSNPQALAYVNSFGGFTNAAIHEVKSFVNLNYAATGEGIFITSFCGEHNDNDYINEHGLLSQWRGYGHNGGFAIIFDSKKLEALLSKEMKQYLYMSWLFADMVYSNNEAKFNKHLAPKLDNLAIFLKQKFFDETSDVPTIKKAYSAFTQSIARYKHRAFEEENEVRIVFFAGKPTEEIRAQDKREIKPLLFRSQQIPYLKLFDGLSCQLPIERIIVGPHKDKEARAASLRLRLASTDIKVTVSDIPYIPN